MTPYRELTEHLEILRRRGGPWRTPAEKAETRRLWEAQDRAHQASVNAAPLDPAVGISVGVSPRPPAWEKIELEFAPVEEPARLVPASNDPPGLRRSPGPDPEFHEHGTIAAALEGLHRLDGGVTAAMDASSLNSYDVLRVEKIEIMKLFRWDGSTLWVHPKKVQQRAGLVALRVLHVDRDGPRWADPLKFSS